MGHILSAILSPAVGVVISPFPIVGLILILLSDKARANSAMYMAGWIFGNALAFTIAMLCMSAGAASRDDPSTLGRVVALALGALLVIGAIKEFHGRPRAGEEAKTPKWFDKLSKIGPFGAAGFGVLLSALNPKNALLSVGAGAAVGALSLSFAHELAAAALYTLIASSSIIVPTAAFLFAGKRMDGALNSMRIWLVHNNAVIMSVLLLIIGLNMIGKAL